MLQKETMVVISDNSGGLLGKIFQLYKKNRDARPGDLVRVAVKKASPNANVKKGQHYLAVVVRTKAPMKGQGKFSFAGDNAVVLLNPKREPLGTRVYGNVSELLSKAGLEKVLHIADGVF